jgi:hypothetical protein
MGVPACGAMLLDTEHAAWLENGVKGTQHRIEAAGPQSSYARCEKS